MRKSRRYSASRRALSRCGPGTEIGALTDRELLIAGAVAYWCEGSKNKPYNRHYRIVFINSDADLVRLFLRFLQAAGVAPEDLIFAVHIHESADVPAASRFWLDVTGAPATQFRRPILKRHNPATVRKNTGDSYHGCLRVEVRRSSGLYLRVEGWARAAMTLSCPKSREM